MCLSYESLWGGQENLLTEYCLRNRPRHSIFWSFYDILLHRAAKQKADLLTSITSFFKITLEM